MTRIERLELVSRKARALGMIAATVGHAYSFAALLPERYRKRTDASFALALASLRKMDAEIKTELHDLGVTRPQPVRDPLAN